MYLRLPVPQNQDAKPAELEGKGREGEQLHMNYLYLVPVCLL